MSIVVLFLGMTVLFSYGVGDFLSAKISNKMSANTILFYEKLFSVILFALLGLMHFGFPRLTLESILPLFTTGLLSYFGLFFFFRSLKYGKASVVVPIANSYIIFTALLGYLLFNEQLSIQKYIAIALVIIGIFLISINKKNVNAKHFFQRGGGALGGIVTALFWGAGLIFIKLSQDFTTPFSVIFISDVIVLTMASGVLLLDNKTENKMKLYNGWLVFFIAVLFSIAFIAMSYGMKFSDGVTIISIFITSAPLVTLILAYIFLKERLYKHQYIALVLVLLGLILISINN